MKLTMLRVARGVVACALRRSVKLRVIRHKPEVRPVTRDLPFMSTVYPYHNQFGFSVAPLLVIALLKLS